MRLLKVGALIDVALLRQDCSSNLDFLVAAWPLALLLTALVLRWVETLLFVELDAVELGLPAARGTLLTCVVETTDQMLRVLVVAGCPLALLAKLRASACEQLVRKTVRVVVVSRRNRVPYEVVDVRHSEAVALNELHFGTGSSV